MSRHASVVALVIFGAGIANARPMESTEAARVAASAELDDLDRRQAQLDEQLALRERMVRRRLRALYKLSQGGALRLITEVKDPEDLERRVDAAQRLVTRDLGELAGMGEERDELGRDRARRGETMAKESGLRAAQDQAAHEPVVGLQRRQGDLARPVPGVIMIGMSRVRVREPRAGTPPLELPRRSVELRSSPGEIVRAVAPGTVRWVGELEGLGRAVIIDHGDHYVSVTGHLGRISVAVGARVRESSPLGAALDDTISFELSEERMPLDPLRWLRPPPAPKGTAGITPDAAPPARAATLMR